MKPVRVAVIGVGHHGRHHARLLQSCPGADLVGVYDAHVKTALRVADELETKAWPNWTDLLDQVDAVTIAAPTAHHAAIAAPFLQQGLATFVEKPLAFSIEEGARLLHIAEQSNAVFQVGHVERFNPVWQHARQKISNPLHVQAVRQGPYPFRSLDVSVVFDLTVHDIDLVLDLIESDPVAVRATGSKVLSPSVDRIEAQIDFANGARATFSTSRVHFEPVRRVTAWNDTDVVDVDMYRRKMTHSHRKISSEAMQTLIGQLPPMLSPDERNDRLEKIFDVQTHQADQQTHPLGLELSHFIECAQRHARPMVDGHAGQRAIELCNQIERAILHAPGIPLPLPRSA